jgi:hypothetical protein
MSSLAKQKVVHLDTYLNCQRYAAKWLWFAQEFKRIFKDGAQWDAIEGSKAFAFIWTRKEAMALGKNPDLVNDPALATELFRRLLGSSKFLVPAKRNWSAFLARSGHC